MTTDPVQDELRDLVDGLPPAEARRILQVVLGELAAVGSRQEDRAVGESAGGQRRLAFAGLIDDDPDAAARSAELLREAFRHRA